ncbi:MAG TPA: EAL domain-containing protein [Noviherbaspirillum sp.]|nr:EAL domain-containing protein [Noviherbaspirillum sp.]
MSERVSREQQRLKALEALEILDTPSEPMFDRLTQLAATLCRTPIASISLIDGNRQWFKSRVGLDLTEVARTVSICTYTLLQGRPVVVEDTLNDPNFRSNAFVVGPPHVRFYAGIPLITSDGQTVGTLSVMGRQPRRLSTTKLELLQLLADQIIAQMELRSQRAALDRALGAHEELNAKLAHQAEHLRAAQRIAQVGSWEMRLPDRQLRLSEETFRIFGVGYRDEAVEFAAFMSSVHVDDRAGLELALERALAADGTLDHAHRIVRPGGEIRYVHQRGELRTGADRAQVLAGTVQDITQEEESKAALQLLSACVSRVSDTVMITEACPCAEPGPRIVFVNEAFEDITGYPVREVIGRSPRFLQGPRTQRSQLDRIRSALERNERVSCEIINYRKDGREFWVEIDIAPVVIGGQVTHFVSVQRDITERKASEQKIEQLAFFDPLTQLPNRRLLMDRLDHAIKTTLRKTCCGAVLFLDLDNFKSINDTLGHDKGDRLLIHVAQRLNKVIRASNTVARIGGDEFVILLEDLSHNRMEAAAQAEYVAEKVLGCVQEPVDIDGYEHACTTSIGVILFNNEDDNGDELLKRADVAMYQAKAAGRNVIRFFDQGMQTLVNRRVMLERDMRSSLRRGDFILHYQPQVDADGTVVGIEALVRWNHPREGLLYPSAFIPLAEESRLIVQLGQWVLEDACRNLASRQAGPGSTAPRMSVNVSAQQFHHPEFLPRTLQAIEAARVDPRNLKLELSESILVENFESTAEKMKTLKKLGVRFSLDDFGTGYSSLSYLKRLPVDEVKIDRAFVRDILHDPDDAAIVRTIVSLCDILGFDVIAEGVETEGQRRFLAEIGCRVYQGNLFSPPRPLVPSH